MIDDNSILLYNCDYEELAQVITPGTIDLIYTDPPYARAEAIPCYQALADLAPEQLPRGGSLMTIAPHYLLPEIFQIMTTLKYRWQYVMDQSAGSHPRMAMGIEVMYKPVLHFVKQAYPMGRGFLKDMVTIPEPQKDLHKWQQHEAWVEYYMLKFTDAGDTVLDPFMGTGTVGVVAKRNNRKFIGCDNDPDVFAQAEERICHS
jgi:DNA modification methylase